MPELVSSDVGNSDAVIDVARAALVEITQEPDIGVFVSQTTDAEGVSTVLFASAMAGYPDWFWTVSVAQLSGGEPTVLEAELMPGDGAILAPDWVPWADRLEDYKAAQAAIAAGELAAGDAADDDDDDVDDPDDEDADDDTDDDHEHDLDDLGDDPDDGIDFESDDTFAVPGLTDSAAVSTPVGVDEQDEPEA